MLLTTAQLTALRETLLTKGDKIGRHNQLCKKAATAEATAKPAVSSTPQDVVEVGSSDPAARRKKDLRLKSSGSATHVR